MTKPSTQHEAWASGASADAYFQRNRVVLDAERSPSRSTRFLVSHINSGDRVLEVGVANGRVLEQLRRLSGCIGYGTDPSPAAIADGRSRYPDLHLAVGTADQIDHTDAFFDVVLFGFCLYLVDRRLLARVVAEADRVLAPGRGRLMITDFDPPATNRREFKHQPGLWSFKMDYSALWLANPQYVLAGKIAFSHGAEAFHDDPGERIASWVLIKQDANIAYPLQG
jgi:ubiquinone/menaquinone biosynthesis C-methylase UbiE